MLPKVSILIPTYNRPKFFEDALSSALAQTYENIEIVVCDDSTDDETERRIQPYLKRHDQIRYYRNEKRLGALHNFRRCFELSTGEYINYLMDDDLFHESKIERMMSYAYRYDEVTLVTSYREVIDESTELLMPIMATRRLFSRDTIVDGIWLGDIVLSQLWNYIGEPTTVLFRKRDLDEPFGRFMGRDYGCNVDMASWLSLLSRGVAVYIADPLSYTRLHKNQQLMSLLMTILGTRDWAHQISEARALGFLSRPDDFELAVLRCLSLIRYTAHKIRASGGDVQVYLAQLREDADRLKSLLAKDIDLVSV